MILGAMLPFAPDSVSWGKLPGGGGQTKSDLEDLHEKKNHGTSLSCPV